MIVATATFQTSKKSPASQISRLQPARTSLLQRKCACGGSPGADGECEACRKKRLQRKAADLQPTNHPNAVVPPIVHEVLRSPGQPLGSTTRAFMEPRFGHDFSKIRAHKDNRTGGLRANQQAAPALGPRSDGLDDAPYIGPDDQPTGSAELGPGTGTGMGCVTGPLRLVTSGALEGGYTVNDYLVGGLSWGTVGSPGTAGADGRGFKVQLCANYSNDTSLGVSQNFTFVGANQAFLDGAAQYLGKPPGSVTNGTKINEPVLNASNPYAHTGWELQYGAKTGTGSASLVSFADVPRMLPGCKGSADFETCFYSRGGPCQQDKICRTWRWTIDFTGTNTTNTVT